MPRVAGDNPNYKWVLFDQNTNEALPGVCDIDPPSVTTIIGKTLPKPQLVNWAYRQTRESIAGLIQQYEQHEKFDTLEGTGYVELCDILSDADWTDEWLKENGARPDDVRDEAADRGSAEHRFLESLTELAKPEARELALAHIEDDNPFTRAVAKWWTTVTPIEYRGEQRMVSMRHSTTFAGTTDIVWKRWQADTPWIITDLKTRRAGLFAYDSDFLQTDGYADMWDEMNPTEPCGSRTVLIAFDNGSFKEYPNPYPRGSFQKLLPVYEMLKEVKN